MEEKGSSPLEEGGTMRAEDDNAQAMAELLENAYTFRMPNRGDILEGTVVKIDPDQILVDIGFKTEGVVPGAELERIKPETIKVGDQVLVYVVNPGDKSGNVVLSLTRAQLERDWRNVEKLFESGEIFEATVTGYNRGGLIVHLGKVRGFVPASQLSSVTQEGDEGGQSEDLAKLVGQKLKLKIVELDRERNRLILSERAAIREWRRQQKERLLAELQEGDILRGEVSSLCDFGAFVDLGGADGLIHLSELSWGRVSHPSEVLKVGDEVEVYVLKVDRKERRIGLSLKRLQPDPWSQVEERYSVGQLVEGTITKLTNFGAFARLKDDEIEGLIHISELSDERITHPKE
ncbi:MAG TPA: S1 RNA-binding domain-containing protein, partial [Anaerolineae bacterium]|nr:S1 RNA-binding domain-containing protein [Anaerolineae bacterium]